MHRSTSLFHDWHKNGNPWVATYDEAWKDYEKIFNQENIKK